MMRSAHQGRDGPVAVRVRVDGPAHALDEGRPIRIIGAGPVQTDRVRGRRPGDGAQANRCQEEVAGKTRLRLPPGPVARQARVGEGLEPQRGDPGLPDRRLEGVGVDGRIRAAGQDRAVGQQGQRDARRGGHHVGPEDGPARRSFRPGGAARPGPRRPPRRRGRRQVAARRGTGPAPGPSPTPPSGRNARAAGRGRAMARGRRAGPPWPAPGRLVLVRNHRGDRATRRARSRGMHRRP